MNCNYVKSSDPDTIKKLKNLGFVVLEEKNGMTTFMNDPATIKKFAGPEKLIFTFSNMLNYGG